MRIRISHETTFQYAPPTRWVIQNVRLTPRSFDSQYVLRWRVSVDLDGAMRLFEDSLGNVAHVFSHQKAVERFTVAAFGEVETSDAVGVVRGAVETLPGEMFLRESEAARVSGQLRDFAATAVAGASDPLDRLHRLMSALHEEIAFDPDAAPAPGGAAEALALKRASAVDFAHAFIAAARWLEIPARFISGYFAPSDDGEQAGLTAWAEAQAPGLGWVAFDPARKLCADERYVRVAVGFNYLGAAPFRASHSGGVESVLAEVRIEQAMGQGQN